MVWKSERPTEARAKYGAFIGHSQYVVHLVEAVPHLSAAFLVLFQTAFAPHPHPELEPESLPAGLLDVGGMFRECSG